VALVLPMCAPSLSICRSRAVRKRCPSDRFNGIARPQSPMRTSLHTVSLMREALKQGLARLGGGVPVGATFLIYHRVGGGSRDELDLASTAFAAQLDVLVQQRVVPLDGAVAAVRSGDTGHRTVLTFDDGFRDVYENAWPLLRERRMPFTIYLTTAYVGGPMRWEGSTARTQGASALTWDQLNEMVDSGLCTIGNHTHTHVRPERLSEDELDLCSEAIEARLGVRPRHFAYTWGVPVPRMEAALRERFVTCATGLIGRNLPTTDPMKYRRVPVRRTDPIEFFRAKLRGNLLPERIYAGIVDGAKRVGMHG
jgi:peptidoglycan/xylan/chitin deacetylase (PgdA/CDA1 family)